MPIVAPAVDTLPVDHIKVEIAFTTAPDDPTPVWVDVSAFVDLVGGVSITRGRSDEYAAVQSGTLRVALDNTDGRFTPGNTASPYYPNVKIRKRIRVTYQNPSGGPVSYRFTGYVEEWPTEWPTGGDTYSLAQVTASDRFKRLGARAPLRSIIEQEYLADTPAVYYTLGEPTGSTTAGDTSKASGAALGTAQVGAGGALTFGAQTGPGTDAMPAPAFSPTNVTNGKYLSAPAAGSLSGSAGLTLEGFALTSAAVQQSVVRLLGGASWVEISTTAAGKANVTDSAANFNLTSAASVNDGATHHLALTLATVAGVVTATLLVDGVSAGTSTYAPVLSPTYATLTVGGNSAGALFTGTIAHVAGYSTALTAARILGHYQGGTTGFAGERSDQRIARLAGYAGVPAADMNLEVGLSTSIAFVDTTGTTPLQAMQDVAATEGGVLFIDGQGLLRFHARSHRYNTSSALTIDAADIDASSRFVTNDLLLVNDVTASRTSGITFRAVNATSVLDYGTASSAVSLLTTSDNEVMDAANAKANQSAVIAPRLPNLAVDLLTSQPLTAAAVLLDIGSRVTASGLPAQAPSPSVDLFIEGLSESISTAGWPLSLNTSPAGQSVVWQLGIPGFSELGVTTRLSY